MITDTRTPEEIAYDSLRDGRAYIKATPEPITEEKPPKSATIDCARAAAARSRLPRSTAARPMASTCL